MSSKGTSGKGRFLLGGLGVVLLVLACYLVITRPSSQASGGARPGTSIANDDHSDTDHPVRSSPGEAAPEGASRLAGSTESTKASDGDTDGQGVKKRVASRHRPKSGSGDQGDSEDSGEPPPSQRPRPSYKGIHKP